jgi:prolyl oligopeptidase
MRLVWLTLALGVTLAGMNPADASDTPTAKTPADQAATGDPWLWLEDIHGTRSMEWVKQENARTQARFASDASFDKTRDAILQVLDSDARIPYVNRMGGELYNFWRDKTHPRGVWRRTTLAEYRKAEPKWEVLLDIDALNKAEGKRWVFKGVQCLKPAFERCLVSLSPDGGDAVAVREFSIPKKAFVKGGFELPVAKSDVGWIDEDTIYVGTDFGPGSMTASSYPRIVKEWKRGTPLSAAATVHEGKHDDLAVSAFHDRTPGYERDFVSVAKDFFHSELFLRHGGKLTRLDVPTDADANAHREWLLVQTRSPWTVGGATYPSGALLAIRFDDFIAGKREFTVLFKPDQHTALSSYAWTRNHLILDVLDDVKSRLEVLTPPRMAGADDGWHPEVLPGAPALSTVSVVDTDPDHSDEYWLDVAGFLTPASLERGVLGSTPAETIKQEPAFFDASKFTVSQHFVTSKDGTRVPYFEIAPKGIKLDGANRTLLYGYGGFEVSLLPHKTRSNGGLLMGNMLTMYPQLFGAIACEVPLLDMKRYIHLSAGASWMAEYGNPDTDDWNFIKTFSPYQNVENGGHYPPVLFYTATSDDRVGPVQARKMAARMQAQGHKNVWFYENLEGGHGAGADNQQSAHMHAMAYDFLWDQLK